MFAALAVLTVVVSPGAAQAQDTASVAPVALVETFADGMTTFEIATPKPAWRWTPQFPRIEDFEPREDAPPIKALKISRALVGRNIKVGVSLLVGVSHDEVAVSEHLITPGSTVVVDALAKFGVAPVMLSMATVASMMPYLPIVVSVSPQIEIAGVELRSAPYPGYRINLRNLSSAAVSNVHFQSYRGEEKALSGLPRGENGLPLLTPGGSYALDINLTAGGGNPQAPAGTWAPRPLDVIEIDSVRWADGTHTGKPPFPGVEPVIERDGGLRLQVTRVMDAFREALNRPGSGSETVTALKERIAALPDAEPNQLPTAQEAMRSFKAAVLGDIRRFQTGTHPWGVTAAREWLTLTLQRYEAWSARLAA